jgi:hypothetical protein
VTRSIDRSTCRCISESADAYPQASAMTQNNRRKYERKSGSPCVAWRTDSQDPDHVLFCIRSPRTKVIEGTCGACSCVRGPEPVRGDDALRRAKHHHVIDG